MAESRRCPSFSYPQSHPGKSALFHRLVTLIIPQPESPGPPAKRPRYSYDLADSRHQVSPSTCIVFFNTLVSPQSEESMPSPFRFPSQASSSSVFASLCAVLYFADKLYAYKYQSAQVNIPTSPSFAPFQAQVGFAHVSACILILNSTSGIFSPLRASLGCTQQTSAPSPPSCQRK
jgi:hypothetical protein